MSQGDDSFKVSPMEQARFSDNSDEQSRPPQQQRRDVSQKHTSKAAEEKGGSGRARAASGTEGNTLLSGVSEFDKLQASDNKDEVYEQQPNKPKKNLAEEFDLIASKYPDELPAVKDNRNGEDEHNESEGSDKDVAAEPSQQS